MQAQHEKKTFAKPTASSMPSVILLASCPLSLTPFPHLGAVSRFLPCPQTTPAWGRADYLPLAQTHPLSRCGWPPFFSSCHSSLTSSSCRSNWLPLPRPHVFQSWCCLMPIFARSNKKFLYMMTIFCSSETKLLSYRCCKTFSSRRRLNSERQWSRSLGTFVERLCSMRA